MGSAGTRFGRNVPLERDRTRAPDAADAQPAHGQPRAADPRHVPAGDHAQCAGRRLAPVPWSTTGSATARTTRTNRGRSRCRPTTTGPSTRCAIPRTRADPTQPADVGRPADLRQHRDPLVGRAPRSTAAAPTCQRAVRTGAAAASSDRGTTACCRSTRHGHRPDRRAAATGGSG